MLRSTGEARLRQALQALLAAGDTGAEGSPAPIQSRWELPAPLPGVGDKFSATDLLSWWFRAPGRDADPWAAYLGGTPGAAETAGGSAGGWPVPAAGPAPGGGPEPQAASPPSLAEEPSWWELFGGPEPEEALAEEHAEAAIESLYEFLHAIGRRDVEAAMALVADDYHTLEDDQEIDKLRLRQRLEALLDSLLGFDLEVSLATAPEPLFHPNGILIAADIQLDACRTGDGPGRSQLERRIAVLRQDGGGEFRIAALSLVPA